MSAGLAERLTLSLEKRPFSYVVRPRDRCVIRELRFLVASQPPQQVSADRMEQVVPIELEPIRALQRDSECVLDALLGQVDIAEMADQNGHRATVLLTENPFMSAFASCMLSSVPHWPDLNRQVDDHGELAAPLERHVQVRGPDNREPANVLLTFSVRAIRDQDLTVPEVQHGRRAGRMQPRREDPRAGP